MNRHGGAVEIFVLADAVRHVQRDMLDLLGFGPEECAYRLLVSTPHWKLRDYGGPTSRPPVLIVAAPIKRPYIWDLCPSISAVRYCLSRGLHVCLLEWQPPSSGGGAAGLETYGDRAIAECVTRLSEGRPAMAPFLLGHSLGGTLAAVFAGLEPRRLRGLVLVGAPLCFHPASSQFRDAVVSLAPSLLPAGDIVPGSAVSHLSALASPISFIWSRMADTVFSLADASAMALHGRIERWALDEVALSGRLVGEIVRWFYQENRLYRGTLRLRETVIGPSDVGVATLAVVNTADEIAGRATIMPFLDAMRISDVRLIDYPGETGVGLQHLALLVGRHAYAKIWPRIIAWLEDHC
jgi:polyhydroxyalkanoate synthase subunit PhaC